MFSTVPEKPAGDWLLRVAIDPAACFRGPRPLRLENVALPSFLRVVVVAPHPDDFDAIAVTLRHLQRNGNPIDLLVLTSGNSGVEDDYATAHLPLTKAEIREREQRASCTLFGLPGNRLRFLRLATDADGHLHEDEANFATLRDALLPRHPDLVFLPHGNDTNADHQRTCALIQRLVREEDLKLHICLNRDPKTIAMRIDLATGFTDNEATWKRQLLRCHDSQQQRNLRTRQHGFDDRILQDNAQAATAAGIAAPFAELFELQP